MGLLAVIRDRASRTRALPEAYCSQQPRLPHSQRCPPGTTCMWPNSPAIPKRPRTTSPFMSSAPPMPVPRVTIITWLSPCAAPKRHSAHAAALASLSTKIGTGRRRCRAARGGSCRHDRCGAKTTVARSAATKPAAPMPTAATASTPTMATSSSTTSTMVSSTTPGFLERCGVSRRARCSTAPVASTIPPATLVPPMSMPMPSRPGSVELTPRPPRRRARPRR
jgi:hypothetical protein